MDNYHFKAILICEESQAVLKELLALGVDAYSCDLMETSGNYPGRHIRGDCLTLDYSPYRLKIAFPPCTHLAVSGAKHFEKKRADGRQEAGIRLFFEIWKIADVCENPIGILNGGGDYVKKWFPELWQEMKDAGFPFKHSQIIQPWQFGDQAQKSTCLWIKDLPLLKPTNIVGKGEFVTTPSGKTLPKWYSDNKTAKNRSKTFPGIAKSMATQWTDYILKPPIKTTLF